MTSPIRLMLWLKWTLTWRGYRRSRLRWLTALLVCVAFIPVCVGATWAAWLLTHTPLLEPRAVARAGLTLLTILWVITPLLGFPINDAYDQTKLFAYPIPPARLFWGGLLGGFLDLPVLLSLPPAYALIPAFAPTPGTALIGGVVVTLFLLQTLAFGQMLTLALTGFLKSRRFRDVTIVLFPLIGIIYYLGQRMLIVEMTNSSFRSLLALHAWRWIDPLPPGIAARALDALLMGRTAEVCLGIVALAALGGATLWAGGFALDRLITGESGPARARAAQTRRGAAIPRSMALPGIPGPIAAVAVKEWLYFRREPQYKAAAVQTLYTIALAVLPFVMPDSWNLWRGQTWLRGPWLLPDIGAVLLLSLMPLIFNLFGGEGAAITAILSTPAPRRAILLGKNLAHGAVLLTVAASGLVVAAALTGQWASLPGALVWVVLGAPVLLGAGNLMSIAFPHKLLIRGQRAMQTNAGGGDAGAGCAQGVLYLLASGAALLTVAPVLAAVMLPGRLGIAEGWRWLTLPVAALYSFGLYRLLLDQAALWLSAREPEIAERILPTN